MPLTSIRKNRWLPWGAPAVAAVAVAAVALGPRAFAGDPHPSLPARTPAQLITAADQTSVRALSGVISSNPDLGLPRLPGADGGNQISTLLTEPATWSLAVGRAAQQRVALLGTGKEMDVVRNGSSLWTWDSATQSATHYLLPSHSGATAGDTAGTGAERSPIALAHQILHSINPTTRVAVGPTTVDAGRSAYTLVVRPRTTQTLIGKAVIDLDSASGLPLAVTLYPRGSTVAALSEKFTSLTLHAPASSTFTFTPPTAATVHTDVVKAERHHSDAGDKPESAARTVGSGWAGVFVYPAAPGTSSAAVSKLFAGTAAGGHSSAALLQEATNPGPDGSRLLQTRIATVMLTKNGSVLAGAVPASRLEAVAKQLGA